jgi:hypothetical protein
MYDIYSDKDLSNEPKYINIDGGYGDYALKHHHVRHRLND